MTFPEPCSFLGKSFNSEPEKQTAGKVPGRRLKIIVFENLRLDDCDDLMRTRIDDHDLITHENVVVAAPIRIDRDHFNGQRIHMDVGRDTRSHAHRNIEVEPVRPCAAE